MSEAAAHPSLADRFWSHAAGPDTEDLPEPQRSVMVVTNFLAALDHLRDVAVIAAMLRRAEVEGELSYASPEQLRGETIDARAVVFSLGVLLFERATGRHPFGAENNRPRQVERIRRGEMGSGVNMLPTLSSALRAVLMRAMSPFAEERWPDIAAFRGALAALTTAPVRTDQTPVPKLPGAPEVGHDDQTRVVANPLELAKELTRVVDEHEARKAAATEVPPPSPPPPPRVATRGSTTMRVRRDELDSTFRVPRDRPVHRGGRAGVAIGGAIVGAAIMLGAVYGLGYLDGDRAERVAAAPPSPAPQAAAPAPAPAPPPEPEPEPEPEPQPQPEPQPPPAPAPAAFTDRIVAAITPCLDPATTTPRTFGLSILFANGAVVKPYFAASAPLSRPERGCIATAIKGVPGDDATGGVVQYVGRGSAASLSIAKR